MIKPTSFLLLFLIFFSCNSVNDSSKQTINALQTEIDSLKNMHTKNQDKVKIRTFMTFQENNAEEAMNFYVSLFENSSITEVQKHEEGGPAKPGTILFAAFELNGSLYACTDSYIKHEWDFTPGVSNFVECTSNEEIENLFTKLSEGGKVLMPLNNYGWSTKFAFIEDKYGVSWQLNLE